MFQRKGRTRFIVGFLSPALALYGFFVLWPLIEAFRISAYRWSGMSQVLTPVGSGNYQALWVDPVIWEAAGNNLWMLAVGGVLILAIGVGTAHALRQKSPWAKTLDAIYLFPQVVSAVVVAILWKFFYHPKSGPVTLALGTPVEGGILGNSTWALPAVTLAWVWFAAGFYVMLFHAGLAQIPEEVNEAAEMDGSKGMHRFWSVTWPLLWSTKRTAVIHLVIAAMNTFALTFLMTRGQPDRKTEVMLTYLYQQAFEESEYGYATAIAVFNFALVMIVTLVVLWWFRRDPAGSRG